MTDERKPKGVAEAQTARFEADMAQAKPGLTLKVRRIGNSLGVVLPKDVLAKLRVSEGDHLAVGETPEGVTLTAQDNDTAELMRLAEGIMRKRRKVLKVLAQ